VQLDDQLIQQCKAKVEELVSDINRTSQEAAQNGLLDKEKYVIPPHLHDLQEADLPETQRGLVMTEIAQFRERSAKREREKMRDVKQGMPVLGAPSGPKMREWGKPQNQPQASPQSGKGMGKGPQGYDKPVGFVKAGETSPGSGPDDRPLSGKPTKTDEELEAERKEARRRDEEASFRDVSLLFAFHTNSSGIAFFQSTDN
jgi:RNA-binding protein 25